MLPVKHNLMSVKGEYITLVIGYSNLLDASDLFACVRKYMWDEEYILNLIFKQQQTALQMVSVAR